MQNGHRTMCLESERIIPGMAITSQPKYVSTTMLYSRRDELLERIPFIHFRIPSDIRRVVYCTAIGSGNERDWQFLWKQYLKSNVASEKSTILVSLGCSRDIWVLQRYLEWSLQEKSGIRKQDSVSVFHSVVRADVGFNLARAFLLERVAEIHN